ncbi:NitT/TauT family transport system permease protein [Streptomyces sp. CG 926]|uniref:ABC transporter permease n=1 Tax=Streptomyces sp. CG 926 TaxID=1882405 RepID=UPI000D7B5289|nr:NitT/TauT family transport system permease protein [Streptomyces sp. CG 926]
MTTDITTPADAPADRQTVREAVRQDTAPAAAEVAGREPRRTRSGVPSLLVRRLRGAGRAASATASAPTEAAEAPATSRDPEAAQATRAAAAPQVPAVPAAPAAPASVDRRGTRTVTGADAALAPQVPAFPGAGRGTAHGRRHAPSPLRKAAGALGRGLRATVLRSAALVALLVLWETAPRLGLVDATFLPPVSEVATAWWDLLGNGQLGQHTRASLARSFGGFAIAVVVAVPLGLLIGWYRPVAAFLGPLLEVFRNTAALALLPVFVLLLGIGETSKVSIVVYACLWPVLLNTISAVGNADPTLVRLARSMDLSTPRLFQKVILPSSVPAVFTGIRLAGAVSILVLVAAEMIGAKAGLGYLINASQYNFAIPQMYAGIVTISAVGVAFNQLLVTIERRLSTWRVPA